MFSVTFTGFKTQEQAIHFARWYEGSGEQQADYWMEIWAGLSSCYTEKIERTPEGATVILKVIEK